MDTIRSPVLTTRQGTLKDFVRYWEQFYSGYDEAFYRANIGKPLTEKRIERWFEWKNGRRLSATKKRAICRYFSSEERIDHGADAGKLAEFLNRPGGAIWRIFWLHIQHPLHFPIYDQHVHRAMAFMLGWTEREIPTDNQKKVRNYLDSYQPFFDRFQDFDHRQVDRALSAFGQFLAKYGDMVRSPSHVTSAMSGLKLDCEEP